MQHPPREGVQGFPQLQMNHIHPTPGQSLEAEEVLLHDQVVPLFSLPVLLLQLLHHQSVMPGIHPVCPGEIFNAQKLSNVSRWQTLQGCGSDAPDSVPWGEVVRPCSCLLGHTELEEGLQKGFRRPLRIRISIPK